MSAEIVQRVIILERGKSLGTVLNGLAGPGDATRLFFNFHHTIMGERIKLILITPSDERFFRVFGKDSLSRPRNRPRASWCCRRVALGFRAWCCFPISPCLQQHVYVSRIRDGKHAMPVRRLPITRCAHTRALNVFIIIISFSWNSFAGH